MKKSLIFLVMVSIAFISGCDASDANDIASEKEQQIRENVWTYAKGTDMPEDEEWEKAWLNGKIEELDVSDDITSYMNIEKKYEGQTILLVTSIFETERDAYPSILVDPKTEEVIGVLPGE